MKTPDLVNMMFQMIIFQLSFSNINPSLMRKFFRTCLVSRVIHRDAIEFLLNAISMEIEHRSIQGRHDAFSIY